MSQPHRPLHFGVSLGDSGVHPGAWRIPSSRAADAPSFAHYLDLARTAERGLFDMIFTADSVGLYGTDRLVHEQPWREFEPIALMAALAVSTSKVGLVSTASTTFNEPYNIARKFSTLDHLSNGRAAWNAVTSHVGAPNFGMADIPVHEIRYARAEEFLEVVTALWDSWEPDAKVVDVAAGVYADPAKVHKIDYVGNHFSVEGPLNISRSPQGRPVIIQAGSSGYGKNLGARFADVIFTAQSDLPEAQAFYREMHDLVRSFGRDDSQLRILPGISPIVGRTEAEAQEKLAELTDNINRDFLIQMVGQSLHADLSEFDLDDTVPEEILLDPSEVEGHQSRYTIFRSWAVDDKRTIRELGRQSAASQGHWLVVGSAEQVADVMIERCDAFGADGFNIVPSALPQTLDDFVDLVIPELQERGAYRSAYEGNTLRDHLGLAMPEYSVPNQAAL
jgi:FMN-dependent oxidoreductase (nitrilotriacetate monooxygenase family)